MRPLIFAAVAIIPVLATGSFAATAQKPIAPKTYSMVQEGPNPDKTCTVGTTMVLSVLSSALAGPAASEGRLIHPAMQMHATAQRVALDGLSMCHSLMSGVGVSNGQKMAR